jgi:hypothetical protein
LVYVIFVNFKHHRKGAYMYDQSVNGPINKIDGNFETVWFVGNGSSEVTLYEGMGVCYDWDYGTATDADGHRRNAVDDSKQSSFCWSS